MNKFRILIVITPLIYGIYFCYFKKENEIVWPTNTIKIIGTIDDYPENRTSSNRYRLKIKNLNDTNVTDDSKILVITNPYTNYKYGNEITITGTVESPKDFITDTGKTFDYDNYLKLSKIYGISKDPEIKVTKEWDGNIIKKILFNIRFKFSQTLNEHLSDLASNLTRGVLLGEKTSIAPNLRDNLARTSTSHIIALSGYNITIVSEILMKLLGAFSLLIKSIIGILGIFLFIIMAGGTSSAVRSGIMASVLIYSKSRGKEYNALWALLIATSILVLMNPLSMRYDVGFHLSILATYGLIVFQEPISVFLIRKKVNKFFTEIISTTLAASIMSFPYIAYNMGIISILGILANVIVVPLLPALMLFSFLTGIVGNSIIFITQIFSFITEVISKIILNTINTIGDISYAAIVIKNINLIFIILIYVFLFYKGFRLVKKAS
jgi:competence protein ComEC